ncbi:MAG: NmrA family NAD(P)-binding protein [Verrucomicrobia bacterium]|nr:NmrA family NAD(P)-binding protein [Verrucomicrobiota bacterium]
MIKPKILVTGATGRTGGAVVTELLAKDWPVRAAVRVRDARSDQLQRRGAEVVVADIFDPAQLMDAMRGVQRAYYCPPYHPFVIQSAAAFAAAARETGLEQIVGLSQWLAGPNHPALMSRQLWLIDRMFAALPSIAHTVLNPGFFADSPYMEMMPFAAHLGAFPLPVAGESLNAPPSAADIARVAAAAFLDPGRHAGKSYRPTGPELLTVTEMAAVIGRVVGHKVRHVRIPLRIFYKAVKAQGLEPILLSGLSHYFLDHDRGAFAVGAPNDTVREVTGKNAEDFETIARRYAALPESRQSLGARLAAFARFMAAPMLPGFNPATYDRTQEQPVPPTPHLALDDAGWVASHGVEGSFTVDTTLKEALA